ncbi:MAG: hypothetical protein ACO1NU_07215 [Arcticibacter sp.]
MQETTKFAMSPQAMEAIENGADRKVILAQTLENEIKHVEDLLMGYHFRERGSVDHLELDTTNMTVDEQGKGSFTARYILGMYNACADLDLSDKAKMEIDFEVDFENGMITLTGEFFPEREPDDI